MTTEPLRVAENENEQSPSPLSSAAGNDTGVAEQISILDLLIAIAERKRAIFRVTAVFFLLSVVISFLLPTRYTAAVTLLPPQQSSSISDTLARQLSGVAALAGSGGLAAALKNPNDLYVGMLRSRSVEDAMIQRFGLMKEYRKHNFVDARKAFEKHADVDGEANDKMIHIAVEDRDPKRAAEIANGYVEEFQRLSERLAITEASQRRLFFEKELEQSKNKLADAEEALKVTEQSTGAIQPENQAKALIESAAALRGQIVAKEVQIQGMQTYATGENAQLVVAQQELESLRNQLAKLGGSAESSSGELLIPKGRVPEVGLEYIRKQRDVKYYEAIFEILARQFEFAKMDEAKEGAVIQIVDPAVPPDKRSFPKRGLIVAGATIAGFLAGICYALASFAMTTFKSLPSFEAKLSRLKSLMSRQTRPSSAQVT